MHDFDSEYYILTLSMEREDLPVLSPDENTVDRDYSYARQDPFSPPLVFFNGMKDYALARGVKTVTVPPQILFDGSNILIPSDIKDALLALEIPNMCLHPAVYIHDDGKWYEDYWYVAFTQRFDCWDRSNSVYNASIPIKLGSHELYEVIRYSLDTKRLSGVRLQERLLFQMGGITSAPFICHKSLYPLLYGATGKGAELTLIKDY